jgi:hypothetical protein
MSTPFDFNPNDVTVGLPVFDKGSYEIEVGEPKSFLRVGKTVDGKQKADNFGVFYKCKIATGPKAGQVYLVNCYMHTPEAAGFSKSFLMASLGFKKDSESEQTFNKKYENENWKYNPEDKSAGDMWHKAKNQHLNVDLDVTINMETGDKQQKLIAYRPLSA